MIVAIDGPAGAGKSTISSLLAEKTGFFYLNTGNFYRALTLAIIRKNISIDNKEAIIESAVNCKIEVFDKKVYLNGEDVDYMLHTDQIDSLVSPVSAITNVRHEINAKISDAAKNYDIIAEGRDITTVVFPNAEVKIYLDASIENRAKRRLDQGVSSKNLSEIESGIKERDEIDKNKKFGNLKIAEDAIYLNSSDLTIEEVCEKIMKEIIKKQEFFQNGREHKDK